jgi:hypothetical protein
VATRDQIQGIAPEVFGLEPLDLLNYSFIVAALARLAEADQPGIRMDFDEKPRPLTTRPNLVGVDSGDLHSSGQLLIVADP